ncbi:zeta toxin family protein [Vibrio sp. HN007]|uniref:zeta toxin family protein n=1 Tax=Vibrio iocasae TaxID=3098914 RepID=UPI0035D514F1
MLAKLEDISHDITGYRFNETDSLFSFLKITESHWSVNSAELEFEEIIEREMSGKDFSANPKLTIVSGIPYSGKSTFVRANSACFDDCVDIAFDSLMRKLSFYHQLVSKDSEVAFNKCELIARVLGYELIRRSATNQRNIVLEHSSTPEQHLQLYKALQSDFGYQIDFIYIKCSLKEALHRAEKENMKRDGERYTPHEYIEQRYHLLQEMLVKYQQNFTIKVVNQNELDHYACHSR